MQDFVAFIIAMSLLRAISRATGGMTRMIPRLARGVFRFVGLSTGQARSQMRASV